MATEKKGHALDHVGDTDRSDCVGRRGVVEELKRTPHQSGSRRTLSWKGLTPALPSLPAAITTTTPRSTSRDNTFCNRSSSELSGPPKLMLQDQNPSASSRCLSRPGGTHERMSAPSSKAMSAAAKFTSLLYLPPAQSRTRYAARVTSGATPMLNKTHARKQEAAVRERSQHGEANITDNPDSSSKAATMPAQ